MIKVNRLPQSGFGIIEVLVTLAITATIAVVVGQVLVSVIRLYQSSQLQTKAAGYAQESLEIINSIKNTAFACICATRPCASCTRGSQSCNTIGGYGSCWLEYPFGLSGYNHFYLDDTWQLQPLTGTNRELIAADSRFQRVITIENLQRDNNGNIVPSGGTTDYNIKKITVQVIWQERGKERSLTQSIILAAWQNL